MEFPQSDGVTREIGWLITASPVVIFGLYSLLLVLDPTQWIAVRLLGENQLVELLTFATLLAGGILGLSLVWRSRRRIDNNLIVTFYTLFSLGLLFIAMEEISWGQQFFHFATPEWLAGINAQDELTLHNINLFSDYLEAWPLAFGLGGCLGVGLGSYSRFRPIAPSLLLLPWFIIIGLHSAIDLYHEFHIFSHHLDQLINHLDELAECMVGVSSLLYIWLNRRFFQTA